MADFEKINNARKILQLDKEVTLDEVKSQFRKLSKKYHPDSCRDKKIGGYEEKFKQINDAYQIIMEYIRNYKYSFNKKDVQDTKIEKMYREHLNRFYNGWWEEF